MIAQIDPIAGSATATTLGALEPLCTQYDQQCALLETMIAALEADLAAVKGKHLAHLKRQAAVVARREAELYSALEAVPHLFKRPRTVVIAGTKIGYTASPGSLEFDDEAMVIKLIRKHFADRFDELVKTRETVRKDNVRELSVNELARIGCRVEGIGDTVVLTRVAGDVEKLMDKLIEKMVAGLVGGE